MNVPNFENIQFTDRNGMLTDGWQIILQQLISEMQHALSNEGFIPPSLPANGNPSIALLQQQLQTLTVPQQAVYGGDLIYDSTNNILKVFILNATPSLSSFKTITAV